MTSSSFFRNMKSEIWVADTPVRAYEHCINDWLYSIWRSHCASRNSRYLEECRYSERLRYLRIAFNGKSWNWCVSNASSLYGICVFKYRRLRWGWKVKTWCLRMIFPCVVNIIPGVMMVICKHRRLPLWLRHPTIISGQRSFVGATFSSRETPSR